MPNLEFSIPYDTSSWGSCLAKCPAPSTITTTRDLEVDYVYMEGKTGELWEGEQLVYQCKNDTLVIDENPDLLKGFYINIDVKNFHPGSAFNPFKMYM